jgi:hypothetical protein
MKQIRYEVVLEAETPIAHHEGTFGNTSVLMARKVRLKDGSFFHLPIITGDSMRHGMRESAAYALLDAAGLLGEKLGEAALRLLFSGGMVTGRGDASKVSLEAYRRMAELVPTMALFGGCADNRVIPGRLQVEDAQLLCAERLHAAPPWVRAWAEKEGAAITGFRSHVEEVMRVRMDPTLDPGKRKLLAPVAQTEVEKRLLVSELAHEEDDDVTRRSEKSSMMPHSFECLVQGSLFTWAVTATCYSELDEDTFHVALGAFLARPVVGGKKGTGHGKLRAVAGRDVTVRPPAEAVAEIDVAALGAPGGKLFFEHVRSRAKEIGDYLREINA